MHMSDALVSTPVALTMGTISILLIAAAIKRIHSEGEHHQVALMGVMGAFIFAAQMINFSIPGTGSSGHIVGGILLASLLGAWRGFIVLTSIIIVQCLIFADGGLLALGCNIINMAAFTCLVAYPLLFHPLSGGHFPFKRLLLASVTACVVGLELGAFAVSIETSMSNITALSFTHFLLFMLGIHFVVGICEGVATAGVLFFIQKSMPEAFIQFSISDANNSDILCKENKIRSDNKKAFYILLTGALIIAASFSWIASSHPDGLEWSILQTQEYSSNIVSEISPQETDIQEESIVSMPQTVQQKTAILADYAHSTDGIIGVIIMLTVVWGGSVLFIHLRKHYATSRKSHL